MYRNSYKQKKLASDRLIKCNFVIVAVLTISSTALTAYLLNVIVYSQPKSSSSSSTEVSNVSMFDSSDEALYPIARSTQSDTSLRDQNSIAQTMNTGIDWDIDQTQAAISLNQSLDIARDWNPLLEASEAIESKVRPDLLPLNMQKFKEQLALMSKQDLLRLLKILQERIDRSAILLKKRNIAERRMMDQTKLDYQFKEKEAVVHRSEKMSQLMSYLDRLQSNMPQININRLNGLASLNENNKSLVRIVKPSIMNAVLKPADSMQSGLERDVRAADSSWRDQIQSVAPSEGWPQQPEVVVEDWPAEQTTARPKRRKKKKKIHTTTTSTTPLPPIIIETTYTPPTSPAPPTAFEEVWIEEEEDIYRPPRRKLKKYKKKPIPTTTTTTTSTTTTTTTTPPPPTTTTTTTEAPIIEDWHKDHWAAKSSSTSAPAPSWPTEPEQEEKWPEEEWLNTVRDTVQNQLNLIYV